jgi:hypothetical protein
MDISNRIVRLGLSVRIFAYRREREARQRVPSKTRLGIRRRSRASTSGVARADAVCALAPATCAARPYQVPAGRLARPSRQAGLSVCAARLWGAGDAHVRSDAVSRQRHSPHPSALLQFVSLHPGYISASITMESPLMLAISGEIF